MTQTTSAGTTYLLDLDSAILQTQIMTTLKGIDYISQLYIVLLEKYSVVFLYAN